MGLKWIYEYITGVHYIGINQTIMGLKFSWHNCNRHKSCSYKSDHYGIEICLNILIKLQVGKV